MIVLKMLACALSLVPLGLGQVRHLSTDHSGSVLYFAADMTKDPAAAAGTPRIFRWQPDRGIEVFVQDRVSFVESNRQTAGFYGVDSPSVSADGSRVAYMQHSGCVGVGCVRPQQGPARYGIGVVVGGSGGPPLFHVWGWEGGWRFEPFREPGYAKIEISPSGRYVICRNGPNGGLGGVRDIMAAAPEDFSGRYGLDIPFSTVGTRQMLSDTGLAVWGFEGALAESRELGLPPPITEIAGAAPVTNASGTVVAYETLASDGKNRLLLGLERATGRQWFLWADPEIEYPGVLPRTPFVSSFFFDPYPEFPENMFGASIDAGGSLLAIRAREAAGQPRRWLVIIALDGAAPRFLYDAGEEILELTLSGNGKWVFAATGSGRLLRICVESGEATELLGRTPWIKKVVGASASGARNRITGGGFAAMPVRADFPEGTRELAGFRVDYNGQPMPLFEVTPFEIVFRIPLDFDRRNQEYTLRVLGPADSGYLPAPLLRSGENLFGSVNSVAVEPPGAIGEDGTPANLSRPIRPGETISIFKTGWRAEALSCVMLVVFDPAKGSEALRFPVVADAPVPDKPGLFEVRLPVPENVDRVLDRTYQLQCEGKPSGGFVLMLPLRK